MLLLAQHAVPLGRNWLDQYTLTLVVSGKTDNVTPWSGSYSAVHALGGTVEYIHTPTGHVQSVVFPPSDPRCYYLTSDPHAPCPATADEWVASAITSASPGGRG